MIIPVYALTNNEEVEFVEGLVIPLTGEIKKPWSGTIVVRINTDLLEGTGSHMRLGFQARQAGSINLSACYVGEGVTQGKAASFEANTKVQVTVGGSTTINIQGGSLVWSDAIEFSTEGVPYISIAMDVAASTYTLTKKGLSNTANVSEYIPGYFKGAVSYFRKNNVTQASTDEKTGYDSWNNRSAIVTRIQIA